MTLIETEQSRETTLTEITRGPFTFRFLSYRKSEDADLDLRSEDYIVSELNPDKAIFVLCDGVGSSFYGNMGSQILGETLLDWLGKVSPPNVSLLGRPENANQWLTTLTKNLTVELNQKTKLATSIIQKKDISGQDELTQLAEKTQRDDFGTQSNLVCGIVWPKSSALPNGLMIFVWLGNARLRIFHKGTDLTRLLGWGKNPDQLREVWSSKDGVVGNIYSYISDLSKVSTVIAYSDGLENVDEQICPDLDGTQLENLVNESQSIKDDDVTFLELSVREDEVPGIADDVVNLLRKPARVLTTPPEPETDKFKQKFEALQKKYDEQSLRIKRNRGIFLVLALVISTICLLTGFIMNAILTPIINPSPTPTITSSPTLTPSVTASPSATITLTETPTATLTSTPTDTPTLTPTPTLTETPTATGTLTPTMTGTIK